MDYVALKAEILTDPTARGYAGKEDNAVAVLLNAVQLGILIKRDNIAPNEILEAIHSNDLPANAAASISFCSWFESLTQLRAIRLINDDGTNTKVLGNLTRFLTDTNQSQTRIQALATRTGSRAEQLFGRNVIVTDQDVAIARAS
jgi:hypothetical protein